MTIFTQRKWVSHSEATILSTYFILFLIQRVWKETKTCIYFWVEAVLNLFGSKTFRVFFLQRLKKYWPKRIRSFLPSTARYQPSLLLISASISASLLEFSGWNCRLLMFYFWTQQENDIVGLSSVTVYCRAAWRRTWRALWLHAAFSYFSCRDFKSLDHM